MDKIEEGGQCAACMACVAACPRDAITIVASLEKCTPTIDAEKCIDCGRCAKVCQLKSPVKRAEPIRWMQGWATDEAIRRDSSSGGVAAAISEAFVRDGGEVISCVATKSGFNFERAVKPDEMGKFKGSKYVKSDPREAFELVTDSLGRNKKTLFIGLPCQVAAMKKYIGERRCGNLYTVDLICHGTPAQDVLERYLEEEGVSKKEMGEMFFRRKNKFYLSFPGEEGGAFTILDSYTMAFHAGLFFTENCYECEYASLGRSSDLTLGDSWGTDLKNEESNGVSLMLCINEKGEELIENADLTLYPVDKQNAIENNSQLVHPSARHRLRDTFIENWNKGMKFKKNVMTCLPAECLRQKIKLVLNGGGPKRKLM